MVPMHGVLLGLEQYQSYIMKALENVCGDMSPNAELCQNTYFLIFK
jgi:hypothetical protein